MMKFCTLITLLFLFKGLLAQPSKTMSNVDGTTGATTEWNKQATFKNVIIDDSKSLIVIYPFDGSVFPADFSPASFIWNSTDGSIKKWNISFKTDGNTSIIECDTTYFKPDNALWTKLKDESNNNPIILTISNTANNQSASIKFSFSKDKVDAPIFYRAVPLPFRYADKYRDRLEWYMGDVSKNEKKLMLNDMPVCANCHSFSRDGSTLAMDVDYANDKGNYAVTPIEEKSHINVDNIISWSDYRRKDGVNTFGLLAKISPDGRHAVSTVKDRSIFVPVDNSFWYSQLFFPVKGILVSYDMETGNFMPLKGADDPAFVQSSPEWEPQKKEIMFSRAKCSVDTSLDKSTSVILDLKYAADYISRKKDFKFDLYRVPWNDGKGGKAIPVNGASNNNKSNYFARYSPDGKWIVFCQAENFMLLQPDSRLYIMPAKGGKPRLMNCNREQMNSYHSFSPNGKWMVFSSKHFGAYTQLFLTHIDENGNDTPPVWLEQLTVDKKAANIPEFVNIDYNKWNGIVDDFTDHDRYREDLLSTNLTSGNFTASMKLAEKEIEKNPSNYYGYYARARTMLSTNMAKVKFTRNQIMADFNKAAELLNKDIEKDGSKAEPYSYLAAIYYFTRQHQKSLFNCNKALEIEPNNVFVWQTLAAIYYEGSDLENTLKANRKLFDITKKSEFIYKCAQIKFVRQRYDEAIEDAKLALSVERCDILALEVMGNCYLALGDLDKAENYYSDMISCRPTETKTYMTRSKFYLNQKEYKKAIADLSKSLEIDSSNLSALHMRASAYFAIDKIDEAINDLKSAASMGENDGIYFLLAKCYMKKQDFSNALEKAKKAKDIIYGANSFGKDSFKNLFDINKIIKECEAKLN